MTKPLAPHGAYARYVGRPASSIPGCRCELCIEAGRKYCARQYVLNSTGRPLSVPPEKAAAHLKYLLDNGASWNTLRAAGCYNRTTQGLLNGTMRTIHRRTEQKILTIRLQDVIAPHHHVPALGSARRLQALIAIGHQVQQLAAAAGCELSHLRQVLNGHVDTVTAQRAGKISAAYEQLSMTVGSCERSRQRAQRSGWAPPLAWDDIDNPEEVPSVEPQDSEPIIDEIELARLARGDRTIRLRRDEKPIAAQRLAELGLTPTAISLALQVNTRSVHAWLGEAA